MFSIPRILICFILTLLLVGCGGSGSSDESNSASETGTTSGTNTNSGDTSNNHATEEPDTTNTDNNPATEEPDSTNNDNNPTAEDEFEGKRSYSTTDGYSLRITGMAISRCTSSNCFVIRGGQITEGDKPVIFATKNDDWNIVRLLSDGKTLDTSFGENGVLTVSGISDLPHHGWNIDSNGNILVLSEDYNYVSSLSRYDQNGSIDSTFATAGTLPRLPMGNPTNLQTLQDGRILIGGRYTAPLNNTSYHSQWAFVLLTSSGGKDSATPESGSFVIHQPNPSKYSELKKVVETTDHLYLLGTTARYGYAIGRLNKSDFSVDTSFGDSGFVELVNGNETVINTLSVDSESRVVAAGTIISTDRVNFNKAGMAYGIYRYLSDGTPDTSFDDDGIAMIDFGFSSSQTHQINDSAVGIIEEGNKLIITGQSGSTTGTTGRAFSMVRLLENGEIDSTFEIGANHLQVDRHSTKIYFKNITNEPYAQSVILDDKQGRLAGYGVFTDNFGNINTTTPMLVQWWD